MKSSDLSTIRTAYRYVVAYQRRVRDILRRLNEGLNGAGFQFDSWQPCLFLNDATHSRSMPHRSTFVGDESAWDPAVFYLSEHWWFRGERDDDNRAGTGWLWAEHVADTGYEEALAKRARTRDGESEPLEGLLSARDTRSLLRVRWFLLRAPLPSEDNHEDWIGIVKRRFVDCETDDVFPVQPTSKPVDKFEDECLMAGGHVISLDELRAQGDAERRLVEPVVAVVRSWAKEWQ